jgi:hypothetical protein
LLRLVLRLRRDVVRWLLQRHGLRARDEQYRVWPGWKHLHVVRRWDDVRHDLRKLRWQGSSVLCRRDVQHAAAMQRRGLRVHARLCHRRVRGERRLRWHLHDWHL